jgi:VWFA-related protein
MRGPISQLFCLLLPLVTTAQTTPNIRTGTQIVMVDVTVTDDHGNPVHNLKQTDFKVFENGQPQNVTHFEEYARLAEAKPAKIPAAPKLEANVYTDFPETMETGPINLLILDLLNTPVDKQADARRQLLASLRAMKPGQRLALLTLTTHLSMLQGFTTDPNLLVAALNQQDTIHESPILQAPIGTMGFSDYVGQFPKGGGQTLAEARQNEGAQTTQQNNLRAVYTLGALNQLAHYLSGMTGRKNLLWFSASLPLGLFTSTGSLQAELHETLTLLARSQVAIYPVDSRGLTNTPLSDVSAAKYALNGGAEVDSDLDQFSTHVMDEHSTMQRMAKATGGKAYLNANNLDQAVEAAVNDGSNYYTLVYSPENKQDDGSYRKISVRLASGNYKLSYREGYYASSPTTKDSQARDAAPVPDAMHAAMQRGAPAPSEIIFKAMVVASTTTSEKLAAGNTASPKSKAPYRTLTVAYAANPGDITMPERPDGTRQVALTFVALVYDREGQLLTQQSNQVNVFAKPAAIRQFLSEGVRYQQQVAVPAKGEYYLRVGIHDLIGDKVGAIEVPVARIATMAAQPQ